MERETDLKYPLIALSVALIAHAWTLQIWIILWCYCLWLFRYLLIMRGYRTIPRLAKGALTVFGLYFLTLTYGRYTVDSCVALLVLASGLMPLESRTARDRLNLITLSLFLALTALFQSQNLIITGYLIITALVSSGAIVMLNHSAPSFQLAVKFVGKLALLSAPLALLLFIAFPRAQGNIWSFGSGKSASTGFSDNFSPGDLSSHVMDESVAFRATFDGPIPHSRDRYWRGIVFNNFDGRAWRQGYRAPPRKSKLQGKGESTYKIVLEPHHSKWLFALDYAQSIYGVNSRLGGDFTFQLYHPLSDRIEYKVISYNRVNWDEDPDPSTVALPTKGNQRTRELVQEWREAGLDESALLKKAADMFSNGGFIYSLSAPLLSADSMDDFLFNHKRGFCEHYASALAFMLRSAGIPTRIVGGYLGGDLNTVGNYVIVRQSDAHVWVETWINNQWLRVDPTAFVAPNRVEQGADAVLADGRLPFFLTDPKYQNLQSLYKKALFHWDNINFSWDRWMLDYSKSSQQEIFRRLGVELSARFAELKLFLIILAGIALTIFGARIKFSLSRDGDRVAALYRRFLKRAARLGIEKPASMGPQHFLQLVQQTLPERADKARNVITAYTKLRFQRSSLDSESIKELKQAVKEFT